LGGLALRHVLITIAALPHTWPPLAAGQFPGARC